MTVQLVALAVDAVDHGELGRFWADALRDRRATGDVGLEIAPSDVTTTIIHDSGTICGRATCGHPGRRHRKLSTTRLA